MRRVRAALRPRSGQAEGRSRVAVLACLFAAAIAGGCANLNASLDRLGKDLTQTSERLNRVVAAPFNVIGDWVTASVEALHHPAAKKGFTPRQEYYLGRTVTAQILARYDNEVVGLRGKGAKASATPTLAYVDSIAQVVLQGARKTYPAEAYKEAGVTERVPTVFRVAIVKDDAPGAWSAPGGFTVLTTGMLDLCESEDEIAAVLAHEMGHISMAHGLAAVDPSRRQQIDEVIKAAGAAFTAELGKQLEFMKDFTDDIAKALFESGYEKEWEYAADGRGATILTAIGYDPAALVSVLQKLDAWQKAHGMGGWSKTHPPPSERIAKIERAMREQHLSAAKVPREKLTVRRQRFLHHMKAKTAMAER